MTVYVYMVECADQTLYTGWTTDIERRLKDHNAGRGAKYTRERGPVRLVYVEEAPDRRTAMQRELEIKRLRRGQKLELIAGTGIWSVKRDTFLLFAPRSSLLSPLLPVPPGLAFLPRLE